MRFNFNEIITVFSSVVRINAKFLCSILYLHFHNIHTGFAFSTNIALAGVSGFSLSLALSLSLLSSIYYCNFKRFDFDYTLKDPRHRHTPTYV